MRKIVGVLFILGGLALAIYVGLYLMFVGGIVQIAESVGAEPTNGDGVAWGVVRVVFASPAFGLIFWFFVALGLALIESHPYRRQRRGPSAKQVESTWREVMNKDSE